MLTKESIQYYLEERKLEELSAMARDNHRVIRYLFRYLYTDDELIRKRAIEAVGYVCGVISHEYPGMVRDRIRRLWWSLNDESGGIGWSAAEAIAEIIKNRPDEYHDYASIILFSIEEPMLAQSVLWAAGTIGEMFPEIIHEHFIPAFSEYLDSSNPTLRGYAARALSNSGAVPDKLEMLKDDKEKVLVYENGELCYKTVAELAGFKLQAAAQ